MAFKVPEVDSIYLYSDGNPERYRGGPSWSIPQDKVLKKVRALNRARKLKINCYGMSSRSDTRKFLRKLAEENGGEYRDIRSY